MAPRKRHDLLAAQAVRGAGDAGDRQRARAGVDRVADVRGSGASASGCVSITSSAFVGALPDVTVADALLHRVARVGVNERGAAGPCTRKCPPPGRVGPSGRPSSRRWRRRGDHDHPRGRRVDGRASLSGETGSHVTARRRCATGRAELHGRAELRSALRRARTACARRRRPRRPGDRAPRRARRSAIERPRLRLTPRRAIRSAGAQPLIAASRLSAGCAAPVSSTSAPSRRKTTRSAQAAWRASWVTSTPEAPASQRARRSRRTISPVGCRVRRSARRRAPAGAARPARGRSRRAAAGRRRARPGSGRRARPSRPPRARRSPPCGRRAADAVELARQRDVLGGGQRGDQVEVLEDVAGAAAPDRGELRARLSPARSVPSTSTAPLVGESSPPARFSSVDLPEPRRAHHRDQLAGRRPSG